MELVPTFGVYLVILTTGALVGLVARRLLRRYQHLSISLTILYGMFGSGLGFSAYQLGTQGTALTITAIPWTGFIIAVLTTMGVVVVGELARQWIWGDPVEGTKPSAASLIDAGEGAEVEFKSTARWNAHKNDRDERLEATIVRTIAGFLNSRGGTLLIGVDDAGNVLGLENDLKLVRHNDKDRYQLWLLDLLETRLGRVALRHIAIAFEPVDSEDICRVDVQPSDLPVYLRSSKSPPSVEFHVRIGNSTRELMIDEAVPYINRHFRRWRYW